MSADFIGLLAELTFLSSLAIVAVAIVRRPLRRLAGATIAYGCWLLVPLSMLVLMLPDAAAVLDRDEPLDIQLVSLGIAHGLANSRTASTGGWATAGVLLWSFGCLAMLALVITRHRRFIRSLGPMTPMADDTIRCATNEGPMLLGLFRPRIVVPQDFDSRFAADERALMLAHERAHARRGDHLGNGIASIALCAFWFNPLMYWAVNRLRLDQELACDAAVLAGSGTTRRRYAEVLLDSQVGTPGPSAAPVACHWQSMRALKQRIETLKHPLPGSARRLVGALATCLFIVAGGAGLWACQPGVTIGDAGTANPAVPLSDYSADRVFIRENGQVELEGNVVVALRELGAVEGRLVAGRLTADAGGRRLEGRNVRLDVGDVRLRADRVVIDVDQGTFETSEGVYLERLGSPPE